MIALTVSALGQALPDNAYNHVYMSGLYSKRADCMPQRCTVLRSTRRKTTFATHR